MSGRTGARASRLGAVLFAGLMAAVLTGCGSGGYTAAGPFRPLPEGAPPEVGPPATEAPAPTPAPGPGAPARPGSGTDAGDPNVVASGLAVPTALVVLPDGSAIVGERDTGRLLQVFPDRSPARVRMTVPGIDATGDGGLLGLALSPTYDQDGLLYAYLSTATDNRVVRFPLGGVPNPVFTGIPHGAVHNGGGLLFGADGHLLVGTGDTGNPALSEDPHSLAGKVLRIDVFGHPAAASPVYSRGHRDVTALCRGETGTVFATDDAAPAGADELDALADGGDYGPPAPHGPVITFPPADAGLGGCAVTRHTVYLGALAGKRVHVVTLDDTGKVTRAPEKLLDAKYGRLRTVVLDADGGLWVTTSNRDGIGTPGKGDDKVLRILPPTSASNSPL
ncbi:MAG TPA: PQQ-dependent sugar dehydrogenase [Blastococcus sp.]|nr:PQQ-dependent sugar dehydrogenase [Blastococcus sp.]